MAWALPGCSSSKQQHNQIANPFGIQGSEIDIDHPPGVPFYSQLMQQNHDHMYNPYGYRPSSVQGLHPVKSDAYTVFDPNSMRPVQFLDHKQHSGSSNGGFPHLGILHPQQSIDAHGQDLYFYSGTAPTQWPLPPHAPPTKVRQHKAPKAPRVLAWCEFCRVDCVTLKSLEKHKQGKKHKKHMMVFDDMQNNKKALTGSEDNTTPPSQPLIPQLQLAEKVGEEEEKVPVVLNEAPKQPESSKKEGTHPSFTKKVKKRKRNNVDVKKVATEQPNVTVIWECKMCNITCNSQVVFDTHLTGRKHLTNLVRLHGHHSTVGIFNGGEAVTQIPVAIGSIHGEDAIKVGNSNPSRLHSSKRGTNKFKRHKQVKPKAVVASNCEIDNINCDSKPHFDTHVSDPNHIDNIHSETQTPQQPPVTLSSTKTPENGEEEHLEKAQRMETNSPPIEPTVAQSLEQEESHPSCNKKTGIKEGLYQISASDNSSSSPSPSLPEVPADKGSEAVQPIMNP